MTHGDKLSSFGPDDTQFLNAKLDTDSDHKKLPATVFYSCLKRGKKKRGKSEKVLLEAIKQPVSTPDDDISNPLGILRDRPEHISSVTPPGPWLVYVQDSQLFAYKLQHTVLEQLLRQHFLEIYVL